MAHGKKTKVALIRGNSLNEWEGSLWNMMGSEFDVTGFCARKNIYPIENLEYKVERLHTSSDNFVINNTYKYACGVFQKMYGLEKRLKNFDIAHSVEISYFYTLQAVRAKKKNPKLKVVATVWDNSFGRYEYNYESGFGSIQKHWITKMREYMYEVSKGADLFLPVSDMSASMLYDLGVSQEKVKVLTPGVGREVESSHDISRSISSAVLEKEYYLMVNRLVKEKGVYDVLYAWKMYTREKPSNNKVLLIIGRGLEEKNMKRLVREWGMGTSIVFLGTLPNAVVGKLYTDAKALILASLPTPLWQEQFGYVLAESILRGCPVVSTYSGAIPGVVGNAGLLCSPGNPLELKNCLLKLDKKEVYQELKENCIGIKEKFSAENFTSRLTEIYSSLIT